jgi:hypothetical protein
MPIADKITKYSESVFRTNFDGITRQIRLNLASGGTATISFTDTLPADWLQFFGSDTSLYLTSDQFRDVHDLLETDSPVFFTALNLLGFAVGSVHTELDLSVGGEVPGDDEPAARVVPRPRAPGLPGLIRLARRQGKDHE